MPNTKTIKLIKSAYAALDVLDNISTMRAYRGEIFDLAAAGERRHRKGTFGSAYLCSVTVAAELFVVRGLVKYAAIPSAIPDMKTALGMRQDFVLAAMVAANYRKQILKALKGFDLQQLIALDYVALAEGRADSELSGQDGA